MNPAEAVTRQAQQAGDRVAMICDDVEQTYVELYDRSQRLASALQGLGLEPGDRMALLVDNGPATLEQIVGVSFAGLVRVPLYAHDPATRHGYLLDLTDARGLIIDEKYLAPLIPFLAECVNLREIVVVGAGGEALSVDDRIRTHEYTSLLEAGSGARVHEDFAAGDAYQIRFSAGTTGAPKGILHDVAGWVAAGELTASVIDPPLNSDDRYLAAGPLTHAATVPVWPILDAGGTIVVMPSFDVARFLELIEKHRVSIGLVVPTMVQMITAHPDAATRDLSTLRAVYYGTSPMPEATLRAGIELWGNIMYQLYGQSESIPVTILAPTDHVLDGTETERSRLRSAGRPLPGCGLRIVDDDDNDVPAGDVGEILVNSPGRMREIWKSPEATATRITDDGWVRTRDMGRFDAEGYLFLADRKEDMIISGGYNIWPAELENALVNHPAVSEAAVVGVPHPKWGETPHAAVVLAENHRGEVTEQSLIEWTKREVGSVKKVTQVTFLDSLPRTPVGKVLRRVVREEFVSAGESSQVDDADE